ncbi:FkbM family methyltransferase [Chryseobacterium sp.]|uniref:FkbM family methyltransferase n=1 Tax=Chryseobacterium sp. TaxID=1871047 RepID=UPI00289B7F2E|nr:FkbM family methyltransferase [Chryseobacterium sp.]
MKNYLSKIFLALSISRNFSFLKLLINSKRYSRLFKKGITIINDETVKYDFTFDKKEITISMRTFKGDIDIFYEIFWKKAYEIPFENKLKPKVIVDLGAHIGCTTINFHLSYPEAKIYSVEAAKTNFSLLDLNTFHLPNVKIFNFAVFSEDGFINFEDNAKLSYNTKIGESGETIKALTMQSFMTENNIKNIELLKMDIEGAEFEVLTKNNQWLHYVENIILELHPPYQIEQLEEDMLLFGFKIHAIRDDSGLKNIFLRKVVTSHD